jgi:predicted CXXCH cytochrome family protein
MLKMRIPPLIKYKFRRALRCPSTVRGAIGRAGFYSIALWSSLAIADAAGNAYSVGALRAGQINPPNPMGSCINCHIPDEERSMSVTRPRWQLAADPARPFKIFGAIGGAAGERDQGSQLPSLVCLSCHTAVANGSVGHMGKVEHPSGVPYPDGHFSGRGLGDSTATRDSAPQIPPVGRTFREPMLSYENGRREWWVPGVFGFNRDNDGSLPLYTGNNSGNGDDIPTIECTTCHDPHRPERRFMRAARMDGALCMTCHVQ